MSSQSKNEAIFRVEGLTKHYGSACVVDDLSFEIRRGECLGVIGPNGAGKTTTIRLCLGQAAPDAGHIVAFGHEIPGDVDEAKRHIGVVSQFDSLDPDFTCAENLYVYARYFGISRSAMRERVPQLLEFAALSNKANARITELSGGMKRRLSLARALVNDPELLLLDEPTTGLDPQARHLMWERLKKLLQQGKAILLTTHFMDEAERLCDRLLVLDHGRKIAEGTPQQLIAEHLEPQVVELFGDGAQEVARELAPLASRVEHSGETEFLYVRDTAPLASALSGRAGLRSLIRPANLEDLFLKLTGRQIREDA